MPDFLPVRVQDFLHRWKSELREREQIRPGDDGRPLQSERIVGVLILQGIFAARFGRASHVFYKEVCI